MQVMQVSEIACVSQLVKIDDLTLLRRDPVMDKVRPDKSRATGNQNWAGQRKTFAGFSHSQESLIFPVP
jgi:hypothetical protein